jgi:hypothetical protein
MLRSPLLLSDQGTARELLLFIGFMIVEGLSVESACVPHPATLTMASMVVACTVVTLVVLFARKLWLLHTKRMV